MPNQNQFLFDYVREHPELADSLLREEVRKEARRIVHESPVEANELIRESLMVASRSLAESAFFQCMEDPEDLMASTIRRDATARVLELRKQFNDAINNLKEQMRRLDRRVDMLAGDTEPWQEDEDN